MRFSTRSVPSLKPYGTLHSQTHSTSEALPSMSTRGMRLRKCGIWHVEVDLEILRHSSSRDTMSSGGITRSSSRLSLRRASLSRSERSHQHARS